MATIPESAIYKQSFDPPPPQNGDTRPRGWFRVGVLAAASALAGGLAAAWYYRKTLTRLQLAGESTEAFAREREDASDDF